MKKDQIDFTNILVELGRISQDMQMLDQNSNIMHWVRTHLCEIAAVIRQRQPNLSQEVVMIQGVEVDQAKRCLDGVLMESFIKIK